MKMKETRQTKSVCVPLVVTGILWNCSFEQGKCSFEQGGTGGP